MMPWWCGKPIGTPYREWNGISERSERGLDSKFSFLACQGPAKGPLTWDFSQQCCNVPARFERCYEEPLADLAAMSVMVDPTATMRKHETTILGAYPIVSWREGRITGRNSAETMVTVYVFFGPSTNPFNLTFPGRHRKTSPRNRKRRKKRRTATFTIRCGEWLPVWTYKRLIIQTINVGASFRGFVEFLRLDPWFERPHAGLSHPLLPNFRSDFPQPKWSDMLGLLWRFMKHFYTSITSDFTQRLYAIHLSITSGFVRNGGFTTQFSIGRWFYKPPDLGLSNCAVNIPPKPRWSSFSLRKTRDIWGVVRCAESVISFLLLNHGWESIPPSLRLVGAGSGGGRSPEGRRGGGVPQSSPWACFNTTLC